ncbi:uncharacterized protein METZ01_LOCUS283674 [marine metagenome]|uniref:Uncharacterized protein n=1 Tax=marine metagenome TaxID=408172 RepID=A0A382L278_9ZZZZ
MDPIFVVEDCFVNIYQVQHRQTKRRRTYYPFALPKLQIALQTIFGKLSKLN